jgi:murein DD-endopeptidase MepM/ murein hydrolase activator NlpD
MSSNLPSWGKGPENRAEDLPRDAEDPSPGAKETRPPLRRAKSKSEQHKLQAINDAQQGLHSLLNHPTGDGHPHIISSSGATRYHTRGRVAGPVAEQALKSGRTRHDARYLPQGGQASTGTSQSLSIVPGSLSASEQEDVKAVPQTGLSRSLARASYHLQTARTQASLLINVEDAPRALALPGDGESVHVSQRAAARWATRYAMHIVIVLVVAALVGFGGFKSLTVQGAYPNGLQAVDAYTGTDHFDEDDHEHADDGSPSVDSPEFEITLPRTELSGADAAANSKVLPPVQPSGQDQQPEPSAGKNAGTIVHYTVAQGDTIRGLANEYNVMPETIMGSNGIYDVQEDLAAGRVLVIPPVDGMYYVAQEGDTLEGIARYYQVEPSAITSFAGNNVAGGVVKAGQALVVPGGMMPPREAVITYTVRPGDILKSIAARFGVDVPTIINSNDIPDPDSLQIGSQIRLLPVVGIEHKVKPGDTINAIADRYGVTPQMVLDYVPNHLTTESKLQVDQVIMVPGGRPYEPEVVVAARVEPSSRNSVRPPVREQPQPEPVKPSAPKVVEKKAPAKPEPPPKPKVEPKPQPKANSPQKATGQMVWPVQGRITQYFSSRHNGLDIAIKAGTPIHAADAGKVIWSGWRTDGLGYCVMIDHGNNLTTIYGHMIRQPPVYVGQWVARGQVIGNIGSTGRSTGPHVHFMVKVGSGRNYRNPLSYLNK